MVSKQLAKILVTLYGADADTVVYTHQGSPDLPLYFRLQELGLVQVKNYTHERGVFVVERAYQRPLTQHNTIAWYKGQP